MNDEDVGAQYETGKASNERTQTLKTLRERKSKYKYYTVIPEFFDLTRFLNSTFFIFGETHVG